MQSEKAGVQAASALVDRGIENVYLLTGGLDQFLNDFPSLC